MAKRIAIVLGHPDPDTGTYCHALAHAYEIGAREAGHEVARVDVASLDFKLLRTKTDYEAGAAPEALIPSQEALAAADHWVVIYPLWLGTMPALLKGFLEQVLRPGYAYQGPAMGSGFRKLMAGKSARIVITMGMPALVYRWFFRAHSLKSLERNILGFVGIGPIRESLIGLVDAGNDGRRKRWLDRMRTLGRRGV